LPPAISLVLSTALSIYLFDFVLTAQFAGGASLVVGEGMLFG